MAKKKRRAPSSANIRRGPSGRRPASSSARMKATRPSGPQRPTTPRSPASGTRRTPPQGGSVSTTTRTVIMRQEPVRAYRPGLSLSVKFSFFISFLLVLVSLSWGMAVVGITRNALYSQILRQGVTAVRTLAVLGAEVLRDYNDEQPTAPNVSLAPLAYINSKTQSDVLNAVVYYKGPPPTIVFSLRSLEGIGAGSERLPDIGTDVDIQSKTAAIKNVKYPSISFETPITLPGRRPARAMLLLNSTTVKEQLNTIIKRVILFGIVFVIFGIALSFILANMVTHPIKQLANDMVVVAKGNLDHFTRVMTGDEIGLLASSFNQMVSSLRSAQLIEKESERLQSELNAAREIQANLLPEKTPDIPGYDFRPYYHSAKEVGGDYYDIFALDYDHIVIVVADVSGKGIPGSMEMARTRTILHIVAPDSSSASEAVIRTNALLAKEIKRGMFVTLFLTILELSTRRMTCVSAGHNAMYVYRAASRQVEAINPNGIALGFDPGPIFERTLQEKLIQLERGDRFVLYTDGVVEAMSPQHEEFGDDKLINIIKSAPQASSRDMVNMIISSLTQHQADAEQHDDITIVTGRIL
ncbi:MAG: PP2C family protein-serine/threonine phosphatase [Planctomycetes bacterium]|nr:PP2C family protein-serine/threonine phosphatase [Planctomycetota bacterium]